MNLRHCIQETPPAQEVVATGELAGVVPLDSEETMLAFFAVGTSPL
jgi:hypothetical protein